ncbi:hypothetical protein B0O99DRAFT_680709 [Bisporella sp. PMI_857]|nr:hypothetical protein B0O99DRAFT_680709 [Bisporella sp. PMI_857]
MHYNTFLLYALAASSDLVAAGPMKRRSYGLIARDVLDTVSLIPRFIAPDGSHSTDKPTDLILFPNGKLVSKRDPDWKSAKAEAIYKTCGVAATATALCLNQIGAPRPAVGAAAAVAVAAGSAEAAVKWAKANEKKQPSAESTAEQGGARPASPPPARPSTPQAPARPITPPPQSPQAGPSNSHPMDAMDHNNPGKVQGAWDPKKGQVDPKKSQEVPKPAPNPAAGKKPEAPKARPVPKKAKTL